jgi:hypothetical protein
MSSIIAASGENDRSGGRWLALLLSAHFFGCDCDDPIDGRD